MIRACLTVLFTAGAALAAPVHAQPYPQKRIDYYIAFVPGGESDVAARYQQAAFRRIYPKRDMVIQYKPGAGGAVAWAQLNTLPANGYSIMGINLPHIVLQPMEGQVQYKTAAIAPVYWFHYTPDAIVVAYDSPLKTYADLVKAAKAQPGKLALAGSGTNSANHLAHERFNALADVNTTYVPYKGTGELTQAVLGRHIEGAMTYITLAAGQKSKVRMLAVAMDRRHPLFPDVPTFKELGYQWIDGAYRGVAVPKATPPEVQQQVSAMIGTLNLDADLRRQMAEAGFEVIDIPVEKNAEFLAARIKDYSAIAKRMGLVK